MKSVRFRSTKDAIDIQTELSVLDALLAKRIGVKMLCKGRGLCATCHVYVTQNPHCLTPQTDREKLTLSLLTGAQPNSRLACQSQVIGEGVEIALPEGLYVESFSDLESLIGKRTAVPILHPVDGRVLIQPNKIITRSAIMELKQVDFNVQEVQIKE
ncbi:2Fe-2S iron-sulfur cluster-binding protein [Thioflexithrix psekupsensis]|jgi:ferredoxin|uniref:(2Fe-2S)-binding protein n=1 Tax=Thioflexithrix psekupsensis TaxID=1570016 RepID=A0A251X577_9GAMM|nr:2Fe-2S iron-sulfur cluster-binding protein [Thioflexithrix psekupsensis]OUD12540.1 (2Fe-2S)-binding protein [Thioflexithrix psekupsensis]